MTPIPPTSSPDSTPPEPRATGEKSKLGEVCEHDRLKRQCNECDMASKIAALEKELAEAKKHLCDSEELVRLGDAETRRLEALLRSGEYVEKELAALNAKITAVVDETSKQIDAELLVHGYDSLRFADVRHGAMPLLAVFGQLAEQENRTQDRDTVGEALRALETRAESAESRLGEAERELKHELERRAGVLDRRDAAMDAARLLAMEVVYYRDPDNWIGPISKDVDANPIAAQYLKAAQEDKP